MTTATYPFLDRIRTRIDNMEGKSLTWLAGELGKTPRSLYNITDFTKVTLGDIDKISALLEINFIEDYNRWLLDHQEAALSIWQDSQEPYEPKINRVTVNLKISAPEQIAEENLSKMISEIRRSGEKLGFKLD